ncbi:hypothetical protein GGF46_001745 [Coemansia sp. RSA 552]|nr:hypothetical protein GGF46_001745 [Coemansia sp. RSA 552]
MASPVVDDEDFELVDYTAASGWERFVASLEAQLGSWQLSKERPGCFDPDLRRTCSDTVLRRRDENEEVLCQITQLCTRTCRLAYKGSAYLLTLSVHPLLRSDGSEGGLPEKLALFNAQFPPTHLPELEIDHSQATTDRAWHPLHRWTGSPTILYLQYLGDDDNGGNDGHQDELIATPRVEDNYSVSLETAKFLMSSMSIALQNARCRVPAFVPVGDAWRCLFTGRATVYDQLVVRKFDTVSLPQAPTAYLQLSGLLELFVTASRVLSSLPPSRHIPRRAAQALGTKHGWEFIGTAVELAALHIYRIKNKYTRDWNSAQPDFCYRVGDLNVGPANDPLRILTLNALFRKAPCRTYVDPQMPGRDRLYLKTASAWLLTAQMLPAYRERTMLTETLEDAFAAWAQSTDERHRHLNMAEQMEAHAEITGDMLIDLFGPSTNTHIRPPGLDLDDEEAQRRTSEYLGQTMADVYGGSSQAERPPDVSQLIGRMPYGIAVPRGSLLWRLSEIVLVATAKRSADFWGAPTIMTFLRLLWAMALKEIRWRWENAQFLPRVPTHAEYTAGREGTASGVDTPARAADDCADDSSVGTHPQYNIHLKYALVFQKLEMLNCCMERKLSRNGTCPAEPPNSDAVSSLKPMSSLPVTDALSPLTGGGVPQQSASGGGLAQRIRTHVRDQIQRRLGSDSGDGPGSRIHRPIGRLLASIRPQGEDDTAPVDIGEFEEIKAAPYASDSDSDGFVSAEDIDYEGKDDAVTHDDDTSALLVDRASSIRGGSTPSLPEATRLPANAIQRASPDTAAARDSNYVDVAISSSLDSTSGFYHVSDVYERESPVTVTSSADTRSGNTEDPENVAASPAAADELGEGESSGGLRKSETMRLLETGEPMWIPKIQMHPVLSEDMLHEREAILMSFGTSTEGAQQRARLQGAGLLSDMESFKAANPHCTLADFVRWHSPRDWIVEGGQEEAEGHLSARMTSGNEDSNLWQQLWSEARRIPADQQAPLFNYEMEAEKALHYLEGVPAHSLFGSLLPTVFLIAYERLYKQPVIHRIAYLRERLAKLGTKTALHTDWSAKDPDSPVYGLLMDDLEDLEVMASRCVSLLCKFPGQYVLVETLVKQGQVIVDDRSSQKAVLKALAKSNILTSVPASREYVFTADLQTRNDPAVPKLEQRMYTAITDDRSIRVVYGRSSTQDTSLE